MRLVLLISILTILASCQNKRFKVPEPQHKLDFPVIIDDANKDTMHTVFYKTKTTGDHRYYYIGEKKDTIQIARHILPPMQAPDFFLDSTPDGFEIEGGKVVDQFSPYFLDLRNYIREINYKLVELKITVDTSQVINNVTVKSYPVMIENISQDTFFISEYWYTPLVLYAEDTNSVMKPIEWEQKRSCRHGDYHIAILPPKAIIISSVNVYSGDYSTKMYLRIGENVSNEFYGNINLGQFKEERW